MGNYGILERQWLLGERTTEQAIQGVNLLKPIDNLGILIKEGDTQGHFQNVQEMIQGVMILKENSNL